MIYFFKHIQQLPSVHQGAFEFSKGAPLLREARVPNGGPKWTEEVSTFAK